MLGLLRRAPCSTLFPYTTLFRSAGVLAASDLFRINGCCVQRCSAPDLRVRRQGLLPRTLYDVRVNRVLNTVVQDRKSTRLNSSHTVISYAVFCLKKKNKSIIYVN